MDNFNIKTKVETVYVKKDYFSENKELVKILDPIDEKKQIERPYLFLKVEYKNNNLLIPLKSKVEPIKKYGRIGHSIPSADKPNAGLEYRKILIINDDRYLEHSEYARIPASQQFALSCEYETIRKEIKAYVDAYVKAAIKNRIDREPKFRESSLINFHKELRIDEKRKLKQEPKTKNC